MEFKKNQKVEGVLFDFNGTLFFDSHMHVEAFGEVCEEYGIPRFSTDDLIKRIFGRTNQELCKAYFKADATDEECDAFAKRKRELYFETCLRMPERFKLAPGAYEMLDYLKDNGIPYALATGSDGEEVEFFIKHLGISRWFSYGKNLVYNDGTYNGKPAPDCYILAAKSINLDPSRCVVFEDGRSGIKAAHAANAAAVIAVHESDVPSPVDEESAVDMCFNDHTSWRDVLGSLGLLRKD